MAFLPFLPSIGFPPFFDENPFGIYQKILAGKIEFPRHFDVHAKDLIKKVGSGGGARSVFFVSFACWRPDRLVSFTGRFELWVRVCLCAVG